jgi:uncharacterized membrane protein
MRVHPSMCVCIGIVFLFAATSFAEQVKTDYDRSMDFSQWNSFKE